MTSEQGGPCSPRYAEVVKAAEKLLSPRLQQHVAGVWRFAQELLEQPYFAGLMPDDVRLAVWLHDAAKGLAEPEARLQLAATELDPIEQQSPVLWHGIIAAQMAQERFGIIDQAVQNAVRYHTTGRAGMSGLEEILYLADALAYGRSYPQLACLRRLALADPWQGLGQVAQHKLAYVLERQVLIHPRTLELYNYWLQVDKDQGE